LGSLIPNSGSKKLKKNDGSPENISQGSPESKKSESSSTASKLQLKQQKKDAERIQKSVKEYLRIKSLPLS